MSGKTASGSSRAESVQREIAPLVEAMDLCLACKGCKAECPSAVDMAKLRYEFVDWLHSPTGGGARRRLRDYLFGYLGEFTRMGQPFAGLINRLGGSRLAAPVKRSLGIAGERPLPQFAARSLSQMAGNLWQKSQPSAGILPAEVGETVLFLADAFCDHFYPQAGLAALKALNAAGCRVLRLPVVGAGRTLISKGFLDQARAHAARLVAAIRAVDPEGVLPVVGVEPSEIYTLCDEYLDLLPEDEYVKKLAQRAYTMDEFLIRPSRNRRPS